MNNQVFSFHFFYCYICVAFLTFLLYFYFADMKTLMSSEPIVEATATIADESEEVADVKIFSLIAPKKPVGLAAKDPFGSDDDNEDFFAAKPKAASTATAAASEEIAAPVSTISAKATPSKASWCGCKRGIILGLKQVGALGRVIFQFCY